LKNEVHKIVFASVLKPCDDARSFGKLAKALSSKKDVEIHLIGKQSQNLPVHDGVFVFKPLFTFKRTSWQRLFTEFVFLFQLLQIKPQTVIVSTYELLWAGVMYKWMTGAKLIYDVQENYMLNVRTGTLQSHWLKKMISAYIRQKEKALSHAVDHFILAEQCYQEELPFIGDRYTLIENKVDRSVLQHSLEKPKDAFNVCITGTLGRTYGTITAIKVAQKLKTSVPNLRLTLIGYCADEKYLREIEEAIKDSDAIHMIGGGHLVPHEKILAVIAQSHFAFMFYEANESFRNKIPSKFYECIALGTYIVAAPNPKWSKFLSLYQAGMAIDPSLVDVHTLSALMQKTCLVDDSIFFETEKQKLLMLV
jgi:glycogen synthase